MIKICIICKEKKDITEFCHNKTTKDGLNIYCKDCQKEYYRNNKKEINSQHKEYRTKNKEKEKLRHQKYRKNNLEKIQAYQKQYREINKEKINKNRKEYDREYYQKNKKKRNEYRMNLQKEKRKNPFDKLIQNLRNLIRNSLKRQKYTKSSHTYKILGIEYQECLDYLFKNAKLRYPDFKEQDFLEKNKYHIDHTIPLVTAKTEEDVIRLCHYTNLQLLTAKDNLTKYDSV